MKRAIFLALFTALTTQSAFSATVTYEGILEPGLAVLGVVTGAGGVCGLCGQGGIDTTDFWKFSGVAGQAVTLSASRIDPNLELALVLFFGETTADDSARAGVELFTSGAPIGLTLIGYGDDEIPFPGGPYGDPLFTTILPSTGVYTVAVSGGVGSLGDPASQYSLLLTTPEPGTYVMLAGGLIALGAWRRKPNV